LVGGERERSSELTSGGGNGAARRGRWLGKAWGRRRLDDLLYARLGVTAR
jgi:hypothetical protein